MANFTTTFWHHLNWFSLVIFSISLIKLMGIECYIIWCFLHICQIIKFKLPVNMNNVTVIVLHLVWLLSVRLVCVAVGFTAAYEDMVPKAPQISLLSLAPILSILLQMLINISVQLVVWFNVQNQPWSVLWLCLCHVITICLLHSKSKTLLHFALISSTVLSQPLYDLFLCFIQDQRLLKLNG